MSAVACKQSGWLGFVYVQRVYLSSSNNLARYVRSSLSLSRRCRCHSLSCYVFELFILRPNTNLRYFHASSAFSDRRLRGLSTDSQCRSRRQRDAVGMIFVSSPKKLPVVFRVRNLYRRCLPGVNVRFCDALTGFKPRHTQPPFPRSVAKDMLFLTSSYHCLSHCIDFDESTHVRQNQRVHIFLI